MKLWTAIIDNRGRATLIAGVVLMCATVLVLFQLYGADATWRLWRIEPREPAFLDLRAISGAAESYRDGYEPAVDNPHDPLHRPFNQTWFWRLFFLTDIDQDDTLWMAGLLLTCFFTGAILFPQKLSTSAALWMLLILFSPAAMLLYERGNVDLLAFFVCAMAILAVSRVPTLALTLVVLGTLIKMFPVFGSTVFLGQGRKRAIGLIAGSVALMLIYFGLTLDAQRASWEGSSRPFDRAYGALVLLCRFFPVLGGGVPNGPTADQWSMTFEKLALGFAILALALILIAAVLASRASSPLGAEHSRNLSAFRMGASIYVGTFLLGNNWDYRLTFLVFVIPQLVEWSRPSVPGKSRVVAIGLLIGVALSCWYMALRIDPYFLPFENPLDRVIVFDEMINWLMVPGFTYLLVLSSPDWLRPFLRRRSTTTPLAENC